MDGYGTERLAAKDAESAIVARICEDFTLTPVLAKAHYDQMAGYFAEYGQVPTQPGAPCYLAVANSEPGGKPLARCAKRLVRLELSSRSTVLRLMPSRRAMAALAKPTRWDSRWTSAQSSTWCTPSSLATSSARSRVPVDDGGCSGFDRREVLSLQPASARIWARLLVIRQRHTCSVTMESDLGVVEVDASWRIAGSDAEGTELVNRYLGYRKHPNVCDGGLTDEASPSYAGGV